VVWLQAADSGHAHEPPTNIHALALGKPFVEDIDASGTRKVKLYFVAPGIYNTTFSRFPPQVHILFYLQVELPSLVLPCWRARAISHDGSLVVSGRDIDG
jgi:hypothetical protein